MYNALNEDFMFQEMRDRRAALYPAATAGQTRRWWHKAGARVAQRAR
jgi:hypothetical protein